MWLTNKMLWTSDIAEAHSFISSGAAFLSAVDMRPKCASDNKHLAYPVKGVLLVFEQGTDLGISQAVFHERNSGGALGAPCVVNNPKFIYLERE